MQNPNIRRFTLLDAVVLIAATGAGFALVRFSRGSSFLGDFEMRPMHRFVLEARWTLSYRITPVLVCLCLATPSCSLVPRGPGRWRRVRAPGMIACLSVVLVVAIETGHRFVGGLANPNLALDWENLTANWFYLSPQAVLIAWTSLWLVGRWRPGRGWPDRLGRWIGWTWLIAWVLDEVLNTIESRMG